MECLQCLTISLGPLYLRRLPEVKKKFHKRAILVSRIDALISYTGQQLDEAQADVWMKLIFEAKDAPLGDPVTIKRASFLRAIGRSTSERDYKSLTSTMLAFTAATVVIEARRPDGAQKYLVGDLRAFHMLSNFEYDASHETYLLTIDPRWKQLFDGREYALINWERRLQISQCQDMAKSLQRLVATSSDRVQRYALDWLKDKLQYASPMRKFKVSLLAALRELERVRVITGGRLALSTKGREQAVWTRLD